MDAGLAASLAILVMAGWRCLRELEQTGEADRWTTHTFRLLQHTGRLLSAVRDAETDERGFLLSGDEQFLAPYHAAVISAGTNLSALKALTADNPGQQERLAALETSIQDRLAYLKEGIELRRTQSLDAAMHKFTTGRGRQLMDDVRRRIAELQTDEELLLRARSATEAADLRSALRTFLAGSLFSLLILSAVFLFLRQENIRRRRAEAELRSHRDDLEAIVDARTRDIRQAEEQLRKLNEELAQRVAEQTAQIRQANEDLERRVSERTAELQAAKEAVQASRGATLSLLEDSLEARAATEQANEKLKAAVESLETSRKAALNLMEDSVRARTEAEAASAELRKNQKRLLKLNRVLKALKDSSLAMVRSTSEAEYLAEVCRIVVEDCGHAMVWIGFAEDDEDKTVRAAAYSGFDQGYLETLHVSWADTDLGRGPTGTAIRTGQLSLCREMLTNPAFAPWRAQALSRGYACSVAVPLLSGSRAFGALTIYAKEPDAFSEDELKLLIQLADDVAYCIRALRLQIAKAQVDLERGKFVSLADNSTVFIAMCGRDFVPFYVNEAGLRLVGLNDLAQACRTPFSEFFFPEDRKHILQEFLPSALRTGRAEVEIRFRHFQTGKPLWMLYNVFYIKDAAGNPIGLGIVGRNISDRKQAEQRAELLAETASQLLASDSPQLVVEDLCHRVLAFLDCQLFFNYLVDERANRLHLNACAGIPAEDARRIEWLDFGVAVCGCAARDEERIVAEDIQHRDDPRTELVKSFGLQAYAAYPLIVQGRVFGTLSFGTRDRPHFNRAEI